MVNGYDKMPVWAQEIFTKTHEKHMQAMGTEMRARHSKIDRVQWVPEESCVHVYFEHDWYHYDANHTWY